MSYSGGCPRSGSKRDGAKSFKQSKWNEKNVLIWRTFFFGNPLTCISDAAVKCVLWCVDNFSPFDRPGMGNGHSSVYAFWKKIMKILRKSSWCRWEIWEGFEALFLHSFAFLAPCYHVEWRRRRRRQRSGMKAERKWCWYAINQFTW